MATFKGREVKIVEYPRSDYFVIISAEGGKENVKLTDLTLSKEEIDLFFKQEQEYIDGLKKIMTEKTVKAEAEAKKIEAEAKKAK